MAEEVLLMKWPCQALEEWATTFQQGFKEKFGADIPTDVLLGLVLVDWMATKAAETSVLGHFHRRWHLIEVDAEGHLLTGEDLYSFLLNDYKAELLFRRG